MIGYTAGVFDLFHVGHLRLLQAARQRCDFLIVGVTTDELCQETKGKTPVIPFHQRMEIVKGLSCVDSVVSQNDTDKVKAMDKLGADILFVGDDHYGEAIWNRYGSEVNVVYLPYTNDISASRLRKRIYDQA